MSNVKEKATKIIQFVSDRMNAKRLYLAELDALTGDGDMGVTIALIFRACLKVVSSVKETVSISEIFEQLSEQIGDTAPSTFGTLVSTMLEKMSETTTNALSIDGELFAKCLKDAADAVSARGGAKLGDKTLLDALYPAAFAAHTGAGKKDAFIKIISAAAEASRDGSEKTAEMKAVTGRAGYMGDRTIGNKDPGAEAIALILESLAVFFARC